MMGNGRWVMVPRARGPLLPPWVACLHATLPIVTPYIALAAGTYDSSAPCWNILYSVGEPPMATHAPPRIHPSLASSVSFNSTAGPEGG